MINSVTVAKNTAISRHVITFFRRVASGSDKPTTAIIKAIAVPKGIPFATKTSIIGTIPAHWHTSAPLISHSGELHTNYRVTYIARRIPPAQIHA